MNKRISTLPVWVKTHPGTFAGLIIIAVVAIMFPFLGASKFYIRLATEIFIFALLAMSLDVLLGYTGLLSFMHNAYMGVGAYATGLFLKHVTQSLWGAMLVGVIATAVIALVIGLIQVRTGGLPFALLTIAFGMMLYTIVWKWDEVTGGDNGLMGVPLPNIAIGGLSAGNTGDPIPMYFLALVFLVIGFVIMRRIVRSPFGAVLEGISQNEPRATFIGYNTAKFKLFGWLVACIFAGLSGTLFMLYKGNIAPPSMGIFEGAAVLMMLLLGGLHSLWGPIVGAGIYIFLADYVSTITMYWKFFVGVIVILLVLFLPKGVAVTIVDAIRKRLKRSTNNG
jgi:branched-chain amino acid transport system permease protein